MTMAPPLPTIDGVAAAAGNPANAGQVTNAPVDHPVKRIVGVKYSTPSVFTHVYANARNTVPWVDWGESVLRVRYLV